MVRRLRVALRDLFDEAEAGGTLGVPPASQADAAAEAQTRLEAGRDRERVVELRQAIAAARVRARMAEHDYQTAAENVRRLEAAIDEALWAGNEPVARATQRELNLWRGRLDALAERCRAEDALADDLSEVASRLQRQIAAAGTHGAVRKDGSDGKADEGTGAGPG
jgi:hypothetical protein